MASIINASTSGAGGLITTADNTGNLNLQSNGTTVLGVTSGGVAVTGTLTQGGNNVLTSASLGSSAQAYSANLTEYASTGVNMRNRIINGDMRIDQRNAGAAQNNLGSGYTYTVDRWTVYSATASKFNAQQNAGSVTPPTGYTNYLGITVASSYTPSTSDYNILVQKIEANNISDLGFGAAGASTVTLSFWVRSSLTGTHSGFLCNSALGYNYPFTFTISSANTWEQKSITITGATAGTWLTGTNTGLIVGFNLGNGSLYQTSSPNSWVASTAIQASSAVSVVGTNGATFYITGVQLEIGSTATPFERRMYGQELNNCFRYYYKYPGSPNIHGMLYSTGKYIGHVWFPTTMRTTPTIADLTGNYNTIENVGVTQMYMMRLADNTYLTTYSASAEL